MTAPLRELLENMHLTRASLAKQLSQVTERQPEALNGLGRHVILKRMAVAIGVACALSVLFPGASRPKFEQLRYCGRCVSRQ
jgi:hypothetical protein